MKVILVIFVGIVAISNAIPTSDNPQEALPSNFDSNGPQQVDDIVAIEDAPEASPLKRVARHYGGVSVGIGIPVVSVGLGYGGYGGGYGVPYYGGGWGYGGGYGGGWGYGGGYGGGWGYRGYGHHHHHHHHGWGR